MKFKFRTDSLFDRKWTIDPTILKNLDFSKFDLTWANVKPNTLSIPERMNNSDNLISVEKKNHIVINEYSKYNYRFIDGQHVVDTVPFDHILEECKDWKVEYRYNANWFRSDNFKKDHDGLHIVFSGCSNTEGMGADVENTWSHMLYSDIAKQKDVSGYFNLAKSGTGWPTIIQNFHAYVKDFGSPDYLFILMPNILRYFEWNGNGWNFASTSPWYDKKDIEKYIKMHRKEFPVWALCWYSFLDYCKFIGTNVIWSTWDEMEIKNIKSLENFKDTFFPITPVTQKDIDEKYSDLLERKDAINARDGHDGYIQQTSWYHDFRKRATEIGLLDGSQ